jgi:hypothetical protein
MTKVAASLSLRCDRSPAGGSLAGVLGFLRQHGAQGMMVVGTVVVVRDKDRNLWQSLPSKLGISMNMSQFRN